MGGIIGLILFLSIFGGGSCCCHHHHHHHHHGGGFLKFILLLVGLDYIKKSRRGPYGY